MAVIWKRVRLLRKKRIDVLPFIAGAIVFVIVLLLTNFKTVDNVGHCPIDSITEQEYCGDGEALAAYHDRVRARLCGEDGR